MSTSNWVAEELIEVWGQNLDEYIGSTDLYISLQYTERFHDKGDFTLKAPFTESNSKLLKNGRWILNKGFIGYIETIDMEQDDNGFVTIIAKGVDAIGVLDYRANLTGYYEGDIFNHIKRVYNNNTTGDRALPNISIAFDGDTYGVNVERDDKFKSVLQSIKDTLSVHDELGMKTSYKKWFEGSNVYITIVITFFNSDNTIVVNPAVDVVPSREYINSIDSKCNVVIATYSDATDANKTLYRTIRKQSGLTGLNRVERVLESSQTTTDQTEEQRQKAITTEAKAKFEDEYKIYDIEIQDKGLGLGYQIIIKDFEFGVASYVTYVTEIETTIEKNIETKNYILGYE